MTLILRGGASGPSSSTLMDRSHTAMLRGITIEEKNKKQTETESEAFLKNEAQLDMLTMENI